MSFTFNINTRINSQINTAPVINAVNILKRDMENAFTPTNTDGGEKSEIGLKFMPRMIWVLCTPCCV